MKAPAPRLLRVAGYGLAGLLGLACPASAAPVALDTLLRAPVPRDLAAFGRSVALSDDGQTVLVGAMDEGRVAFNGNAGAAYVFAPEGEGWGPGRILLSSDTDGDDRFGSDVALSADGNVALIGAFGEDCNVPQPGLTGCGAAYVFSRNGADWVEEAELTAATSPIDLFGFFVALAADGATALVAAHRQDCSLGEACGVVYVYARSGAAWTEQARLTPSDPQALAEFGSSVALSADGNIALIGSHRVDCSAGPGCGAAYFFLRSGGAWTETGRLTASDPEIYKLFGSAVALSGDGALALIGAPFSNCNASEDCGSAYLFTRGSAGWTEAQRIIPFDPTRFVQFGVAVALARDGSAALIGAPGISCPAVFACGAVYRFRPSGAFWVQDARIQAPSPPAQSLGFSVALSNLASTLLIGAPGSDCPPPLPCQGVGCPSYVGCGAAYIFGDLPVLEIPAASEAGLLLLTSALAGMAVFRLWRQRNRSIRR